MPDKTNLTYGIISAGALGSLIGTKLLNTGCSVSFIARHDFEHIKANGLKIQTADQLLALPQVSVYKEIRQMPVCDVVILITKTTANADVIPQLPEVLKPDGVVLVLQNGISCESQIAHWIRETSIFGGICRIKATKVAPGHIVHYAQNNIDMACFSQTHQKIPISERLKNIAADFTFAGFTTTLSEDLKTTRWKKLIYNIPISGLSVTLNASLHKLFGDPVIYQQVQAMVLEALQIAQTDGAQISEKEAMMGLEAIKTAILNAPDANSSMKDDFERRLPMETSAIHKMPLIIARKYDIHAPLLEALYKQLTVLDLRRQKVHLGFLKDTDCHTGTSNENFIRSRL